MSKIFISHYTGDHQLSEIWKTVFSALTSNIVEVWYSSDLAAEGGISGGKDWRKQLFTHLAESEIVLALLTPNSIKRSWIMWECGAADGLKGERGIFPISYALEIQDIPAPLQLYQVYDGYSKKDVIRVCEQVIKSLHKIAKIDRYLLKDVLDKKYFADLPTRDTLNQDNPLSRLRKRYSIKSFPVHSDWITDADFIGAGEDDFSFISVSNDRTIKLINAEGNVIQELTESHGIKCMALASDGRHLLYGTFGGQVKIVQLRDALRTPQKLFNHSEIRVLDVARERWLVASGGYDNKLRVYSLSELEPPRKVKRIYTYPCQGVARAMQFSDNTTQLAFSEGSLIIIADVASGRFSISRTLTGHSSIVCALSWFTDSTQLISGDQDGVVIIWDMTSRRPIYRFERLTSVGAVRSLAFHPDNSASFVVGGTTGNLDLANKVNEDWQWQTIPVAPRHAFINRVRWDFVYGHEQMLLACGDAIRLLTRS